MIRNLWNSLFGVGRTDIKSAPMKEPVPDNPPETSNQILSLDEEVNILAKHFGALVRGRTYEIELQTILQLIYRKRRKADAYYALAKKLKDDYGVELRITSRTSKNKED